MAFIVVGQRGKVGPAAPSFAARSLLEKDRIVILEITSFFTSKRKTAGKLERATTGITGTQVLQGSTVSRAVDAISPSTSQYRFYPYPWLSRSQRVELIASQE